uniref:Conotoxin superfamily J n=1 Tax=Conus magus TaxID=6492 RepID=A0A5P8I0L5_CONMA|nr:conotoxin superfamily J [Conus magus]
MTSVQSVTCCCLLWLMLSLTLVTPGSPGPAQLPGHRAARVPAEQMMEELCPDMCNRGEGEIICTCVLRRHVVSPSIRGRKRSMAV